ncbi:hypothetical protein [Burkholderia pseudomallei]|uniref:hypothetical protein n=1 Tax=Burkholderia pseudomallei TaxID=28450 RepID=UPI000F07BF6E|nr:hypothetical protein [Burkholderia pseudomallei]CAJ3072027.1 Uncharacterised protein [Burkholderia pseudomallei]VCK72890.1 Uncharacterised protein [Burkholderia pseudomallei]VCK79971.1 Uncharacterised protein [Burkholderia pseudomallei]VCK80047.1 Uncharacterised protein [Burkholderia pseudomallei]VCK80805.1 Uncharacterised protein [Burkholderia pseudomallei]
MQTLDTTTAGDGLDDSFLLPAGDASELDDLDEEVRLEDLERSEHDRIDQMEAIATLDVMVRALRAVRLVGSIVRVNPMEERALIRLAPGDEQPKDIPARWRDALPEMAALDLHVNSYTERRRRWLLGSEGESVTFSLGSDGNGLAKANAVRPLTGDWAWSFPAKSSQPTGH